MHQTIYGTGRINVSLELRMYVGAEAVAADRVIVRGVPDVEMEIKDGVHGDRATAAMVVNSHPAHRAGAPGRADDGRHSDQLSLIGRTALATQPRRSACGARQIAISRQLTCRTGTVRWR